MIQACQYSWREEIANSVTHGIGLALSIAGLFVLVFIAAGNGNAWHIASAAVYGTTLVLLYAASTLYHAVRRPRLKRLLRVLDHSAIYLLIAGTYTPFTLVTLSGGWGWSLFGVVWGITVGGIVFKVLFLGRFRIFSVILYLMLGWLAIVAIKPIIDALPVGGLILLFAGGLAYSLGVIFYAWKSLPYHHAVWHLFVMSGSLLHYLAVLFFVIPR